VGSAGRAEAPVHPVAAIGDADEVARLAGDGKARGREADADGGVPGGDVLADAAPAQPCDDRLGVGPVANRAAQASAGDHSFLRVAAPGALVRARRLEFTETRARRQWVRAGAA